MMYNTRYLPENFEQCRFEKTILRQFPYNLNVRFSKNALVQDGGKHHEKTYVQKTPERLKSPYLSHCIP